MGGNTNAMAQLIIIRKRTERRKINLTIECILEARQEKSSADYTN